MNDIEELVGKLAQEGAAVRPAPHPFTLGLRWLAMSVAYLTAMLLFSGVRNELGVAFQHPWFVAEIALLVAVLVATSLSAALLSFPDLYQMRRIVWSPLVVFSVLTFVLLFAWRADMPPAPFPLHSIECTLAILLVALLPGAWLLYFMRGFASTHYQWAGSIALLHAFSVGALWLRLQENNDSILHVLQWHYLPMIIFGILGLWLGKLILKW
ncbi:MAG: DUF1109 domain-containing protein [Sideroxydans sp.]|nr:DUF1109 domain-containing protein [Sideroxydans sp.]